VADPDQTTSNPLTPVATGVAANRTTCAIRMNGELWCWGGNEAGAVGIGTVGDHRSPVRIAAGRTFTALDVQSGRTCALSAGARYCTGFNYWSYLGDGARNSRALLAQVGTDADWTAISLGAECGLGLGAGNALRGWGSGLLGTLWQTDYTTDPVALGTAGTWDRVEMGRYHVLAIRPDGTLDAWGSNQSGQLGDGTQTSSTAPVPVSGGGTWSRVSAGASSSCGIRTDGSLYCWGDNSGGLLGNGTYTPSFEPVQVGTLTGWTRVAIGQDRTCGIRGGALFCWGGNYGSSPVVVAAGTTFSEVATGDYHACAISAGHLLCWGGNSYGELGNGTISYATTIPGPVGMDADWTAVSLAFNHSCGLKNGGELWCWGSNEYGALGDGTGFYATPQLVAVPAPP
jgi:alpha-tubulin suppressor-like RCC1 family protein